MVILARAGGTETPQIHSSGEHTVQMQLRGNINLGQKYNIGKIWGRKIKHNSTYISWWGGGLWRECVVVSVSQSANSNMTTGEPCCASMSAGAILSLSCSRNCQPVCW